MKIEYEWLCGTCLMQPTPAPSRKPKEGKKITGRCRNTEPCHAKDDNFIVAVRKEG